MLKKIKLQSIILNKMIWVSAEDVYSGLNINKEIVLEMIDAADLKNHNGTDIISEWALLAIDVQMKEKGIEREFVLI